MQVTKSKTKWPLLLALIVCPFPGVELCGQTDSPSSTINFQYDDSDESSIEMDESSIEFQFEALPPMIDPPLLTNNSDNESADFSNEFASAYEHLNVLRDDKRPFEMEISQLPQIADSRKKVKPEPRLARADFSRPNNRPLDNDNLWGMDDEEPPALMESDQSETIFQSESDFAEIQSSPSDFNPMVGNNNPPSTLENNTWWKQLVSQPLHATNQTTPVDTNSLVYEALKNSPRIQAISQNPLIRDLQIMEANADFDPISFVRSKFEDRNDPVGNTLTTGGADFLEDHIWSGEFGLRKKNRTGASVEVSERLGFQNSNSSFFVPQDQGTATLALNYTQPLLRGRGRYYNESQILIAQATSGVAWDTFVNELQDELQQIAQGYWRLYYDRSLFLQKKRNVERGETILAMLEGRSELDSLPSQISRARSAVQSRKTDLANAFRDVRNSETELRRRIADRNWMNNQTIEMLPIESPVRESLNMPLDQVVFTALEHRNEIKEVMKRAKIAGIQKDISSNELLPELSLLMGTYVSALKGESQIGQAIQDQLGENKPGYSVGIEFELPIRNRAARSRLTQRKLQVKKIKSEVDETILDVIAESQIALRRVNSAIETMDAAELAIAAARADLQQNYRRWESFGLVEGDLADGQTPTTMLDQLLDSQERLTAAELVYAQAELELKTAEIALQRTMGTLLIHESVSYGKTADCDTPGIELNQFNEIRVNQLPVKMNR